jgi:hypothetical protein
MVDQSIEFLKIRRAKTKQEILADKVRGISMVALVIYSVVLGGIFSTWFALGSQEKNLLKQIDVKETRIEELKEVESSEVILKQRLSALSQIFAIKRLPYADILSRLNGILGEGIILANVTIESGSEVIFTGEASNSPYLAKFINRLLSGEEIGFGKITLTQLNRDETGKYSFSISLTEPR